MARLPSASPELESGPGKRKRESADGSAGSSKKRRKRKTWSSENRDLDEENGINLELGRMSASETAVLLEQQMRKFHPNLSSIEAEELSVPGMYPSATVFLAILICPTASAILDTADWTEPRLTEKLQSFLRHAHNKRQDAMPLDHSSKINGTPHTIVVTSTALRAADLARVLRVFQTKKTRIAKLFSKHIKLKDAIETMKHTRIGIGVGTPTRLIELLQENALKIDCLERVVVDVSRIDKKTRGMLDTKETQEPLMKLLGRAELKERVANGKLDLVFY